MPGVSERLRPGAESIVRALAGRVSRKKALAALARKLAVIMHALTVLWLVHGRDVDETIQTTAAA